MRQQVDAQTLTINPSEGRTEAEAKLSQALQERGARVLDGGEGQQREDSGHAGRNRLPGRRGGGDREDAEQRRQEMMAVMPTLSRGKS